MKSVLFPYGKEKIEYKFGSELVGVLDSQINEYKPKASASELILEAMKNPVGKKTLYELFCSFGRMCFLSLGSLQQ